MPSNRQEKLRCEICGCKFTPAPRARAQKTCSVECRRKMNQARHAAWQREKWRTNPAWRKARIDKNAERRRASKKI
jgi:hypothetical protein